MKLNKRAQFFLIAALIISGVILSFGKSYTQSSIQEENAQIYDLADQFKYEASQVIDNGLIQGKSTTQIKESLENLTEYYAKLNPDSNIDIIFGNESSLNSISKNQTGGISFQSLSSPNPTSTGAEISSSQVDKTAPKKINVKIPVAGSSGQKKVDHSFEVAPGQNFYLIVRKKIKDQDVVIYR